MKIFNNLISWLSSKISTKDLAEADLNTTSSELITALQKSSPCCSAKVHIVYRGVSDDRLYIAYDRNWSELKFFRPQNLRAYCQQCRKRIY